MKKNVLRIFSLLLYAMIVCTILSVWVEREMTTLARISEREYSGKSFQLPRTVLFADDEGEHLYRAVNGYGWNNGLQFNELPEDSWSAAPMNGIYYNGVEYTYRFVMSASRQPQGGAKVTPVDAFEQRSDRLLCTFPHGIPEDFELPKEATILAQSDTAVLIESPSVKTPFFEHSARGLSESLRSADRIYSLADVRQLLDAVPFLIFSAILILIGFLLWAVTCILSIHTDHHKKLIIASICLIVAILCGLAVLMNAIDLPASLMPPDHIYHLNHYRQEITQILTILNTLGVGGI